MRRYLLPVLALLFGLSAGVPAAPAQTLSLMPVDEVRQGMKGFGRTVFQGNQIDEFQVEVLGVLRNFAPRQDMILVRLSGGPLDRTGVIQGMSGSPVYIDGRLVGAVAFAFAFSKEPIAGIQPISQMIGVFNEGEPRPVPASVSLPLESPQAYVNGLLEKIRSGRPFEQFLLPQSFVGSNPHLAAYTNSPLIPIQTPLLLSGFSPLAIQQFSPFFMSLGLTPIQAGGSGSAAHLPGAADGKIEPGAAVNAELVRGDISVSANGTVTHVDGNKVYAFGHPFMSVGPSDLPMSRGYVISLLPSVQNSFKIAVPLDLAGSFKQDRATGIFGQLGEAPKMIPVKLNLNTSRNTVTRYAFDVVNDRFLTPFLMNFSLFNAIIATERALGEATLEITGRVQVKGHEPVRIGNVFTGDMNGPALASLAAVAPISYLLTSGFENLAIEQIEVDIVSTDRKRNAQLDRIAVDKTEVRPGDTIAMTAYLRGANGDEFVEKHQLKLPAGIDGQIQLLVGDGTTVTTVDLRRGLTGPPKDLQQVIRELNKIRQNDRLYAKLLNSQPGAVVRGEEMPSLPPAMLSVLNSDRSSSRSVSSTRSSTIYEYELPPSRFVIQGQRSLTLTVVP